MRTLGSRRASGAARQSVPSSRRSRPSAARCSAADGPGPSAVPHEVPSSARASSSNECSSSGRTNATSELGIRLGAASFASAAVLLPPRLGSLPVWGLFGGGKGGGDQGGSGGGGGGGDGGAGSGGPLYDLALDPEEPSNSGLPAAGSDPASDAVDEQSSLWRGLITDSDSIEEIPGERTGTRRCVDIVIENWPEVGGSALPKKKDLIELLTIQEGHVFDDQDLADDRRKLENQFDDYIRAVDVRAEYVDGKSNHQRVVYSFTPLRYQGIDDVEIEGADLMPQSTVDTIVAEVLPKNMPYAVDVGVMDKLREKIENWYHEKGLPFCYVGYIDGMEEGTLRAHVTEAKINDVSVRFERPRPDGDGEYTQYDEGEIVSADKIIEAAGFQKGGHYHMEDGLDAMNSIYACGLFEDINIEPEQDPKDPTKINIKIKVEEVEPRSMEMDLEWSFQVKQGLPQLTRQSLVPGGRVEVTHENLFGDAQSLTVSLNSADWRNPAQDLGVEFSYTEPFYKPNTTRNLQVFSTRKVSPVFTGGGDAAEVPPVYVDRFGAKGWLSFAGGEDDKIEHSLMLQQVGTSDDNGQPVLMGTKAARGYYADRGPQTTVSESGRDTSLSYQGYACLDNVQFVNGNQLGRRATLQVDQGLNVRVPLPGGNSLGLSGGLFNRCQASYTHFVQLPGCELTEEDVWVKRKAPVTLVLHGKAGNCIGDMGSYDYFTLGGPHSVRGYSPGELGAARRMVEAAAEVRVPLRNYGLGQGTVYGFLEYGSDLGSSKALAGNPTEYYRKAGHGHSIGAGIKLLGACRFEVARDCNAGTNNFLVNWGERF